MSVPSPFDCGKRSDGDGFLSRMTLPRMSSWKSPARNKSTLSGRRTATQESYPSRHLSWNMVVELPFDEVFVRTPRHMFG